MYLRLYQATCFQGYYYSKPIEIEKLKELIKDKYAAAALFEKSYGIFR